MQKGVFGGIHSTLSPFAEHSIAAVHVIELTHDVALLHLDTQLCQLGRDFIVIVFIIFSLRLPINIVELWLELVSRASTIDTLSDIALAADHTCNVAIVNSRNLTLLSRRWLSNTKMTLIWTWWLLTEQ